MMGFQIIVLWSGVLIAKNPPLLSAWRRVGASRVGMASAVVLIAFALIGLVDSLHYRSQLESKPGQPAVYSVEVLSVLDALVTPLRTRNEKTYSEPFATRLYAKETIDVPGKGTVRDYPRLKYGGIHLGEREDEVAADVAMTAFRAAVLAFLGWLAVAGVVAQIVARDGSGWQKIWRGETVFAWNALLIMLALILLIAVPLFALSAQYHVFGTDKVGQDVLYQILKSVRTGLIIGLVTTLVMLPMAVLLGIVAGCSLPHPC